MTLQQEHRKSVAVLLNVTNQLALLVNGLGDTINGTNANRVFQNICAFFDGGFTLNPELRIILAPFLQGRSANTARLASIEQDASVLSERI